MDDQQTQKPTELVELSKIQVDMAYQLPLLQNRVRDIVDNFDPNMFQAVSVNIRDDGQMYVMDGQHRFTAAKQKGYTHAPAWVFRGMTQAEEAAFFLSINTNRRGYIKAVSRHYAELTAQDQRAMDIQAVVDEFGHKLSVNPGKSLLRIAGIRALHWIFEINGAESLRHVFRTIIAAYPNDDQRWQAPIAATIAQFHFRYPEADQGRLLDVLTSYSARALIIRIHEYHAITVDGVTITPHGFFNSKTFNSAGTFTMSGVEVLRKLYNYRLRSERRKLKV